MIDMVALNTEIDNETLLLIKSFYKSGERFSKFRGSCNRTPTMVKNSLNRLVRAGHLLTEKNKSRIINSNKGAGSGKGFFGTKVTICYYLP